MPSAPVQCLFAGWRLTAMLPDRTAPDSCQHSRWLFNRIIMHPSFFRHRLVYCFYTTFSTSETHADTTHAGEAFHKNATMRVTKKKSTWRLALRITWLDILHAIPLSPNLDLRSTLFPPNSRNVQTRWLHAIGSCATNIPVYTGLESGLGRCKPWALAMQHATAARGSGGPPNDFCDRAESDAERGVKWKE
ncbi:hypothetical protein IWX90DRAFT_41228 [Phyllosticta citrichinensis]|uniref:Uncharacterized protein n=1 Tax=Phyllosticta citrichinensis TaxID=1130410 RepID=A0ABR1Y841_9PEZI